MILMRGLSECLSWVLPCPTVTSEPRQQTCKRNKPIERAIMGIKGLKWTSAMSKDTRCHLSTISIDEQLVL